MLAGGAGSSTHYTSNNFATATNYGGHQMLLMNATMASSVDSGVKAADAHISQLHAIKSSDRGEDQVIA